MCDTDSAEWQSQYDYELKSLKASEGDFLLFLQDVGYCDDLMLKSAHKAYLEGDMMALGAVIAGLINIDMEREAEESTMRHFELAYEHEQKMNALCGE